MEHAFVYLYQAMILIIWHTLLLIGIRFHCTTPKAYFKLAWDSVFTSRKGSEHKGKRKDKKHFQSTECGRAYTCVYIARFLRWNRHSCACHCVASENLTWVVFIPTCIQPDVFLCSPFCLRRRWNQAWEISEEKLPHDDLLYMNNYWFRDKHNRSNKIRKIGSRNLILVLKSFCFLDDSFKAFLYNKIWFSQRHAYKSVKDYLRKYACI